MGTRDPRVDAYIGRAAEFARPVLDHLRQAVHRTCPEAVEEMKWGAPHFNYRGMFCGMAAFKGHCVFGFWKSGLVGLALPDRITTVKDLPSDAVLARAIRKAMKLNEDGVKTPRPARKPKPPVVVPKDLKAALARNARARATFEAFSPSHRREYVEWITEAKTAATRERRLATTLEWLAEGKSRNWKYEKC